MASLVVRKENEKKKNVCHVLAKSFPLVLYAYAQTPMQAPTYHGTYATILCIQPIQQKYAYLVYTIGYTIENIYNLQCRCDICKF